MGREGARGGARGREGHFVQLEPRFSALLQSHDRLARSPGAVDHTVYGLSTSNTRSYRRRYLELPRVALPRRRRRWRARTHAMTHARTPHGTWDTLLLAAFTLSRTLVRPATAA